MPTLVALPFVDGKPGDAGGGLGMTLLYRPGPLALGIAGDVGPGYFGDVQISGGALGGTTLGIGDDFELDALLEIGVHREEFVLIEGFDLGSDQTMHGDSVVVLPYAGARLSPSYRIGKPGKSRYLIGPWLFFRSDLGRATANYRIEECSTDWIFGGEPTCETTAHSEEVGGLLMAIGLRVGSETAW